MRCDDDVHQTVTEAAGRGFIFESVQRPTEEQPSTVVRCAGVSGERCCVLKLLEEPGVAFVHQALIVT